MSMRVQIKRAIYSRTAGPLVRLSEEASLTFGVSYHRFEPTPFSDPKPGMGVTVDTFKRHLEVLGNVGRFVGIDEALEPPTSSGIRFFLCFDDGYRDNADVLLPILEQRGVPCACFVVTDFIEGKIETLPHDEASGRCPAMSPEELSQLAANPLITLGSHSASHRRLADLTTDGLRGEVEKSKERIKDLTGVQARHFAVPFGSKDSLRWRETADVLLDAGFRTLCSNFGGANGPGHEDVFERDGNRLTHLRRVPAPNTADPDVLLSWVLGFVNIRERFWPGKRLPHRR